MARRTPVAVMLAISLSLLVALAACSSNAASSGSQAQSPSTATSAPGGQDGQAGELERAYVSVIGRILPSVVEIRTSSGLGSGVVYDRSGDIVTNAHVVGNNRRFTVLLANSAAPKTATLVGKYAPDDLAVIKVSNASGLRPAVFGDSAKLQVGDIVLAIGNPLGFSSSATQGIVSAVGRTVSEPAGQGSPGATLPDTIQTSAAINPGNSGGALVDLAGQVVGIPTLAATDQQLGGAATGIGFAISANTAKLIASQLVKTGKVANTGRAALGIQASTVTNNDGHPAGVAVAGVIKNGAAAKAGLAEGDVITAVNGVATPDTQALAQVLAGLRPGQVAKVSFVSPDGSRHLVKVKLGQLPAS
jgi:S1-C subfamily serine protease